MSIKILGTLKGVQVKSKVDDNNRPVHDIVLKLELTEGLNRVQEILEELKQIVELEINARQPTLIGNK